MSKRKLPIHIPGTIRAWRRRKRRELKALQKTFDDFRMGVAYTPAYQKRVVESNLTGDTYVPFTRAEAALKEMHRLLSPREWGK